MAQKLPNPVPTSLQTKLHGLTKQQMEQAFEAWEKGFRIEPEKYRTEDETRCLSMSQVSAERTDYFFALLQLEQAKA